VFVIILQVIGIQATSLVAVTGAASLAIGLARQGTLSHMAVGIMLLIFRPFRIGDSIEVAGKSGTVKNLNLFMTELAIVLHRLSKPLHDVLGGLGYSFLLSLRRCRRL